MMLDMSSGGTTAGCWTCCQDGRLHDAGHVVRRDDCRMLDMLSGGRLQDAGHVVRRDDCKDAGHVRRD